MVFESAAVSSGFVCSWTNPASTPESLRSKVSRDRTARSGLPNEVVLLANDDDNDSISLGSYKELYKDLPAQITFGSSSGSSSRMMDSSSSFSPSLLRKATTTTMATSSATDLSSSSSGSLAGAPQLPFPVARNTIPASIASPTAATPTSKKAPVSTTPVTVSTTDDEHSRDAPESKTEQFRVAIRVRPDDGTAAWNIISDHKHKKTRLVQTNISRPVTGRHQFSFDSIFTPDTDSSSSIYQQLALPVVQSVRSGETHGTVFAYGPTGSGKTYTMQGNSHNNCGIILQAAETMLQHQTDNVELYAQFVEIYNEQIRDLLVVETKAEPVEIVGRSLFRSPKRRTQRRLPKDHLLLREERQADGLLSVTLPRARRCKITGISDVKRLLHLGTTKRARTATALNGDSSRSHAVFRLLVKDNHHQQEHVLNLVDLAGSENSTAAGLTSGMHKRETGKINQSLLSLSRVIHALSLPPNKRPKHIGYRDSKLTRLLQPHLEGNARVAVLCCISTARRCLEETRSALKFAASAKRIRVEPTTVAQRRGPGTSNQHALLLSLQQELKETKASLAKLQNQLQMKQDAPLIGHILDVPVIVDGIDTNNMSSASTAASFEAVAPRGSVVELERPLDESWRTVDDPIVVREVPISEVTILMPSPGAGAEKSVAGCLEDAKAREKFLSEKLEATDDLVESLFKELKEEQNSNQALLRQIASLREKVEQLEQNSENRTDDVQMIVQQCMLLKYGISAGLGFFVCGQGEGFLATVLFLWLTLSVVKDDEL